ncbi:RNA polymerase sigma-70 factor [Paenibacillus sp. FJAT-27812]|uniref:RNA polymerase sigma-70 factor n=1 Tax=Paenibacillus sp. FJAT-27812 TaxID=1684143 RepID=UPI0006A7C7EE|nr:RNA polymerase sigma-70 factor [Paenibacillus sp. FJAT-27812]
MEDLYTKYKGLLFKLAYQLTGTASDAEDIVQDVFMKAHGIALDQMANPKAYLCKMTTNRCLDVLKSARKRRELYIGPWLPEPIPTPDADALGAVIQKDLLSYAMLVLLERLTPAERAVFVLREALCFEYADIAELIGKGESNCRKLMSRARAKMGMAEDASVSIEEAGEEWIGRFLIALEQGNVSTVLSLLSEDVVLLSDGGGKALAAIQPVATRERVAQFLFGLIRKAAQDGMSLQVEITGLNGQTGLVIRTGGQLETVALLHVEQETIRHIYFIRNPDKLQFVVSSIDGSTSSG